MSVATGAQKLAAKVGAMEAAYQAALPRMPANWTAALTAAGAPPGPTRQANYARGIQTGAQFYGPRVREGVAKWQQRFVQAMAV